MEESLKSHGTHHGAIEWVVLKIGRHGIEARHSEGAQTVFGLARAREIRKSLGDPWSVRHCFDFQREPTAED